ncbi:MAG: hypothetical protein E6F99_09375 [Actinobacteria bacterium]|nr:MAG: hypothetical protein E6F99_09375 [Actinomycetota bacterium]
MKNKLVASVIVLVIGVALLVSGGVFHNGTPKCDNRTMHPGDLCIVGGTAFGYEARRADDLRTGRIQLILGGVIVLLGGVGLFLGVRDRRRAATVPPPTAQ